MSMEIKTYLFNCSRDRRRRGRFDSQLGNRFGLRRCRLWVAVVRFSPQRNLRRPRMIQYGGSRGLVRASVECLKSEKGE